MRMGTQERSFWGDGSAGSENQVVRCLSNVSAMTEEPEPRGTASLPVAVLSPELAAALESKPGDLVYVTDTRGWLGGLRSTHALFDRIDKDLPGKTIQLGPETYATVVTASSRCS